MTFALHCSDCGKLISNDEWKFNSKKCWGCKANETGKCPELCPYNEDDVRPECCVLAGCTHAGIIVEGEVFSGEEARKRI